MGRAHGFALAATQAVFHHRRDFADARLLHHNRFATDQVVAWRVGHVEIATAHEFAAVEVACRIDFFFVGPECGHLVVLQIVDLGDADTVFAGDHTIQRAGQQHDAIDRRVGGLQHLVVVGIHRQVGVYVTVARVHVQGDEDATAQHFLMNGVNAIQNRAIHVAVKNAFQRGLDFLFPRNADAVILQAVEERRVSGFVF